MRTDAAFAVDYIEIISDLALELGARRSRRRRSTCSARSASRSAWWRGSCPTTIRCSSPASKLAPPLVAGNAVILKAPDQAPLPALRIGELAQEALPPGPVSVV